MHIRYLDKITKINSKIYISTKDIETWINIMIGTHQTSKTELGLSSFCS